MLTIDVKLWKDVPEDASEHIISGITKVFVELGIPDYRRGESTITYVHKLWNHFVGIDEYSILS